MFQKGSYYCARRSTEELTKIADAKSKSKAIEKLLHRFPDSASYLLASKHYFLLEDYEKIIRITQKIDFATEKDELIKMRLISLNKKNFESYNDEVFKWFTICPISKEHYQFYRDFYNPSNSYTSVQASPHDKIINFRIAVYKRDYLAALEMTNQLFEYFSESQTTPSAQIASDIGKAFLYGSEDFSQNAVLFSSYAQKFKNTDAEFYFWFYAGRFYEKAGLYQKRTHDCFENAINSTKDLKLKDNALWYQMDAQLKISVDKTVENILNYAKRWNDSSYFEDFFERLLSVLLTSGRWAQIPTVYKQIDGYASDEITAKYAFIYAQLLQQNIISSPEAEQEIQNAIKSVDKNLCYDITGNFCKELIEGHEREEEIIIHLIGFVNAILITAVNVDVNLQEMFPDGIRKRIRELLEVVENERIRRYLKRYFIDPVMKQRMEGLERQSSSMIEQIEELIEESKGNITLTECADALGVHQTYVWKILKMHRDKSFSDYIEEYKINEAKRLLLETNKTVAEIAEELHYTNPQNFIRFFSKTTGLTPGKFRKLI